MPGLPLYRHFFQVEPLLLLKLKFARSMNNDCKNSKNLNSPSSLGAQKANPTFHKFLHVQLLYDLLKKCLLDKKFAFSLQLLLCYQGKKCEFRVIYAMHL